MSVILTKNYSIRNATHLDFDCIIKVLRTGQAHFFGPPKHKVESANEFFKNYASHRILAFSLAHLNLPVGYAEFCNYPNIEALPKDSWMDWYHHHYCKQVPLQPSNTLFLNSFIFCNEKDSNVLRHILMECFLREPKVEFIVVVEMPNYKHKYPSDTPRYEIVEEFSKFYFPKEFNPKHCTNMQRLQIIERYTVLNKFRTRKALAEDNDDIVSIVDNDRPELRDALGDFYIAEELLRIDRKTDSVHMIVAEISNITEGFIWLNGKVDILALATNYDIEPYTNLLKFSSRKRYSQKLLRVSNLMRKPSKYYFQTENILKEVTLKCNSKAVSHTQFNRTSESSKYYDLRSDFFNKCKTVEKILTNLRHYVFKNDKTTMLWFNTGENVNKLECFEEMSNAFSLQLLSLSSKIDIRRTLRFLAIAFSDFPDRDYCILSVSADTKLTKPLAEILKYFISVERHSNCTLKEYLYITHRSSIYGDLNLFRVRHEDMADIEKILDFSIRSTKVARISILPSSSFFQYNSSSSSSTSISSMSQSYSAFRSLFRMTTPFKATTMSHLSMPSFHSVMSSQAINTKSSIMVNEDEIAFAESEAEKVGEIFRDVLENPHSEYTFLTIRCGSYSPCPEESMLVGYVIIRKFRNVGLLQTHFKLSNYKPNLAEESAEVVTIRLHPFFRMHADIIFREVARDIDLWNFYYITPLRCRAKALTNDLLSVMQPIEPHRIKPHCSRQEPEPEPDLNYTNSNFAVYHNNLSSIFYVENVEKIVIIGFSDVCKAFIRLMIFGWDTGSSHLATMHCWVPHLNITVIAPPGVVEAEYDGDFLCTLCPDHKDCWVNCQNSNDFLSDVVQRLDLRVWVNFVDGNVTQINRIKKFVILNDSCEMYYDKLLLFCDNMYGPPKIMFHTDIMPTNYIQINTRLDKFLLHHKLQILHDEFNKIKNAHIIVFGSNILTFECINFLISHKVPAHCITLVKPFSSDDAIRDFNFNNPYTDANIENILCEMASDLGVTVYEKVHFSHWERYVEDNNIAAAIFDNMYQEKTLKIECDLFISFNENPLDHRFANVLRTAGILIKQNKIIVGPQFHTNDESIFAFGHYIMHDPIPNHQYKYVNAVEAAEKLIFIIQPEMKYIRTYDYDIKFLKPNFFQARLPMHYRFIKVTLPKRYLANHSLNNLTMSTYNDGDFCRVAINEHGIVEQILVVTQKEKSLDFLQFFVGLHETLLNELKAHCYLNEIPNFLQYFQQPWTELIMHARFPDLQSDIRDIIYDSAEKLMNFNLDRNARKKMFLNTMTELGLDKQVEAEFLNFVKKYRKDFSYPIALPTDFTQ